MTNDDHENSSSSGAGKNQKPKQTGNAARTAFLVIGGTLSLAGLLVIGVIFGPILGVIFQAPVAKEDRYHYIDSFLEEIDYQSAGRVLKESYDSNDPHPLNGAYFDAIIQGPAAFETLSSRIASAAAGARCGGSDGNFSCNIERPAVNLIRQSDDLVLLKLADAGTGRK